VDTHGMEVKRRREMIRELVRAECSRLGIDIERRGEAIRLRSAYIDLMVADLSWVQLNDLKVGASPVWRPRVSAHAAGIALPGQPKPGARWATSQGAKE
jgi:hypothetical protein